MDFPKEMLAVILRRVVPPRHLAECRHVCSYWRATIDGRRLVVPHLLPAAPCSAFMNFTADGWGDTYFFVWGGAGSVDARLADAPTRWCTAFINHRNGLLLYQATEGARFVYNPATRRSSTLPPPPRAEPWGIASAVYLVFDPAMSLHHEVFLLPELPNEPKPPEPDDPLPPLFNVAQLFFTDSEEPPQVDNDEDDAEDWLYTEDEPWWCARVGQREHLQAKEAKDTLGLMEWPTSLYVAQVFSSITGRWRAILAASDRPRRRRRGGLVIHRGRTTVACESRPARAPPGEGRKRHAPPSLYVAQVFSSVTGQWEDRPFVREGGPAGTVADMWSDPLSPNYGGAVLQCGARPRYAVYWRRYLYVHCRGGFISRLSLLTGRYVVIKIPEVVKFTGHKWAMPYLSKSQKGVYYTAVAGVKLWVWALNEEPTMATPVWEMVHRTDLRPSLRQLSYEPHKEKDKSWILDDPMRRESTEEEYREWDSDDDDNSDGHADVTEEGGHGPYVGWLDFLGYHPHKEIVFFGYKHEHCAFAYYLPTSKVEYLGYLDPVSDNHCFPAYVQESFVYTPCRIDLLSDQNGTSVDLSNWVEANETI